ncbi:hypothetical protein SCHPADRAFT_867971 [Schizopora paradoxa]|uniref:Aminoacyl-tRNA synthetase class I anticodon-binding domain-containing protein n=1 Tax=Schizopora paradoxa TaxID=27342 RepID=A0A0H2SKL5_9AGAM|nr:hypothetical protein SCHPADRAFT_867971 [Schizopora paradoxa]
MYLEAKSPETVAHELAKELKMFKGAMTVLRYALTGQKVGPPIADVIELLGVQRTLNRLKQCKRMSGTLLHSDE